MLTGVIEGFYGRCWSRAERAEMMTWLRDAGMNLFVYAPKDDIKLRAKWRELYDQEESAELAGLAAEARARGVTMMAAISPCVDITHSDPAEQQLLDARLRQFVGLGISNVMLLFDDIPSTMNEADEKVFASIADAQVHVANECFSNLKEMDAEARLYFCPTDYCGAFVKHDILGSAYLRTIGATLHPDIGITWSGPDIVAETIDLPHILEVEEVLRRKPFIWDNFHANDYDIRRVYAGALSGRDPDILPHIDGWVTNPNNEFEANFVPLHTTGAFLKGGAYDPAQALRLALSLWQVRFDIGDERQGGVGSLLELQQLELLTELYCQPFGFGRTVEEVLAALGNMLSVERPDPSDPDWQAGLALVRALVTRLNHLAEALTEVRNRDLFYTFQPYLQDARIEFSQLLAYIEWLDTGPEATAEFPHAEKTFNFYRKGLTAALNDLVQRDRSGRMSHRRRVVS